MVALGEVADWGSGGTPPRKNLEFFGPGTPWLSIADLNDGEVSTSKESLTEAGLASSSAKVVPPGTVLVAMYGSIGKLGVAATALCTSQAIAFAKPKPGLITTAFLFHALKALRPKLVSMGRGGTQSNIGQGDLKRIEVPLPSLNEQRRIAGILCNAEDLRSSRSQMITLYKALVQTKYVDLFGRADFPRVPTGELMPFMRNGVSPSKSGINPANVLTLTSITRGNFDENQWKPGLFDADPPSSKRVSSLDFLICRGNGNRSLVGAGVLPSSDRPDLVFPDTIIAGSIDRDVVNPAYLEHSWKQASIRTQIESVSRTTSGIHKINQESLSSVLVPLPPMELQELFASVTHEINSKMSAAHESLRSFDEVLSALQSRAFRGEL